MEPGIYMMEPRFIVDKKRRESLTRTVRVEAVVGGYARVVELADRKDLWKVGEMSKREVGIYKWTPVEAAGT